MKKKRKIKIAYTCCNVCHKEHYNKLTARLHYLWLSLTGRVYEVTSKKTQISEIFDNYTEANEGVFFNGVRVRTPDISGVSEAGQEIEISGHKVLVTACQRWLDSTNKERVRIELVSLDVSH